MEIHVISLGFHWLSALVHSHGSIRLFSNDRTKQDSASKSNFWDLNEIEIFYHTTSILIELYQQISTTEDPNYSNKIVKKELCDGQFSLNLKRPSL